MRGTLAPLRPGLYQSSFNAYRRTTAGRFCLINTRKTLACQQSRSFEDLSSRYATVDVRREESQDGSSTVWQPLETLPEQVLPNEHDDSTRNGAASFFSTLSKILNEPGNSPQAILDYVLDSQYFQQTLNADHLGPPELSILGKAFEHVSLEYEGASKAVKNIWSTRALELLRHYNAKHIRLLPNTWATFFTAAASRLCNRCFYKLPEDKYQRACKMYTNVIELGGLVEIWQSFHHSYEARKPANESETSQPTSNDMQQRFFAPIARWQYGQDLATDQRMFCSALMMSAVIFEHMGNLALPWSEPNKDQPTETRRLYFSLLNDSELSLVSLLTSAVHGTTPNRMVLRLGLARMAVPNGLSKVLLDHITLLTGCEAQVQQQVDSRHVRQAESSSPPRGLALRATHKLSKWIERATEKSLTSMYFALTGNRKLQPLASSERPLLEKMSVRLFQITENLPHRIWAGFSFDEKLAGERGTVEVSPTTSAVLLRALYHRAQTRQKWSVTKFEDEWARLDLSKSRIPNALWWLRFKLLWQTRQYRQALEAYPAAIFDITSRAKPEQRSAAVLRLTNQMLSLVAQYGDLSHTRYFLRSLLARKIEFSAATYRWLIRLYIKLGRFWSVKQLLRGYRSHGGEGSQLRRESEMLFSSLIRPWPHCSPTAEKEAIYKAIDSILLMTVPEAVTRRSKTEVPPLQEPHTALPGSFDGNSMEGQLVDGFSLTLRKELVDTYHQLAKLISDGDYSHKAKLLVTLHEHFKVFIPWQRLPLDLRAMEKELQDVVIEHFDRATPCEQLLLASGRLYSRHGDGFLSSTGSAKSNFKIMDASLTSKFVCVQLERTKMAHYTGLFRDVRWPIIDTSPVWNAIPEGQRALLKEVLENLQNQAAKILPDVTETAFVATESRTGKPVRRTQHSFRMEKKSLGAGLRGSTRTVRGSKDEYKMTAAERQALKTGRLAVTQQLAKRLHLSLKEELRLHKEGPYGAPIVLPERHLRDGSGASSTTSSSTTPIERSPYTDIWNVKQTD